MGKLVGDGVSEIEGDADAVAAVRVGGAVLAGAMEADTETVATAASVTPDVGSAGRNEGCVRDAQPNEESGENTDGKPPHAGPYGRASNVISASNGD